MKAIRSDPDGFLTVGHQFKSPISSGGLSLSVHKIILRAFAFLAVAVALMFVIGPILQMLGWRFDCRQDLKGRPANTKRWLCG